MLKLAIKNLAQNKVRLLLTMFAIVLGVGFVVSSFVLRDGLGAIFDNLVEESVEGIDLLVSQTNNDIPMVDESVRETVLAIDGVASADLQIDPNININRIEPVKPDGETITRNGPPQFAFGWTEAVWSSFEILEGRPPDNDEWIIDPSSLEEHGFIVGDFYSISTPFGLREAQLVGTFTFDGFIEGPTFMSFTNATIQEYLDYGDLFDQIIVVVDGTVPTNDVGADIVMALNNDPDAPGFFVQNQEDLINEAQGDFNQALDTVGAILLGFALVSLFVSIFIIANTFAITTSQRTRELGLLRAIGATPRQILRSVIAESVVIGLLASLLGIGAGALIALGIRLALNGAGLGIPDFDVVISPRTIILAFIVGILVTILAAVFPAIGAARTSPIAAISGQTDEKQKSLLRFVFAGVITAIGLALMAFGLFGGGDSVLAILVPLGAGAALLFIGVTLFSPLVTGPLSRLIGAPLSIPFGTAGHLAKENSARNPRRTATTAAALMIGLSLVSAASVLGESFKSEFSQILDSTIQADFVVFSDTDDIPDLVVEALRSENAFGNVTGLRNSGVFLEQDLDAATAAGLEVDDRSVAAFDYSQIEGVYDLSVTSGSLDDITNNTVGIRDTVAEEFALTLGDSITIVPREDGAEPIDLTVVSIHEESQVSGEFLVTTERFADLSSNDNGSVAAAIAGGVDSGTADRAFDRISSEFPSFQFQSSAEFRETVSNQIDFILNLLTILLALTIFIALLGIANTLALSVFERTRELGLLRAVGMVRKQTRRMIRWEAVIISAVGAILGTVLGVALGAIVVQAIPEDILSAFAIPWIRIGIMVFGASLAGILAAVFPAWRASRLNVLAAISGRSS